MNNTKYNFIEAEQLKKILKIDNIKVIQKLLREALPIKDSGVFKAGGKYLIEVEPFINYLKNKDKKKEDKECGKKKTTSQEFTNEAISGGCLIPAEESNIANQLIEKARLRRQNIVKNI